MPHERPSSSAYQCPGYGHRVKGAYGVARDRFATPDPATAPQGFGSYEEEWAREVTATSRTNGKSASGGR